MWLTPSCAGSWTGTPSRSSSSAPPPFALRAITQEKKALRLWGIDAPEAHYQGQSQGAIAEQATRALKRLVKPGDRVRIHTAMDRVDGRGRLLGRVFKRGTDLNKRLLASGWTLLYQIYPNLCDFVAYREAFVAARKANKGLHARVFEWPFEFRQRISKSPPTRMVGDFSTGYAWYPTEYPRVAPENRIFFNTAQEADRAGFLLAASPWSDGGPCASTPSLASWPHGGFESCRYQDQVILIETPIRLLDSRVTF